MADFGDVFNRFSDVICRFSGAISCYLPTLSAIFLKICAATAVLALLFSKNTVTAYLGLSCGKKPQNQECSTSAPFTTLPVWAVAVLPQSPPAAGKAALPVQFVKTPAKKPFSCPAVLLLKTTFLRPAFSARYPWAVRVPSTRLGVTYHPPFATAA